MRYYIAVVLSMILLVSAGCGIRPAVYKKQVEDGEPKALILSEKTEFKKAVIEDVTNQLHEMGYAVTIDGVNKWKKYDPAEYQGVVFMQEFQYFKIPKKARNFNKHSDIDNTVFVITADGEKWREKTRAEAFPDAVTCASNPEDVSITVDEVMRKLKVKMVH